MSWLLWLTLGLVIGVLGHWAVRHAEENEMEVKWYEWLMGAAGIVTILLGIQNCLGSLAEYEPKAALGSAVLFGIPGLILIGSAWYRSWNRSVSQSQDDAAEMTS